MTTAAALEALVHLRDVGVLEKSAAGAYAVDGRVPELVVRPASAVGMSAVLRAASTHGLKVIPRGGGTAIDLGNAPAGVDVVLDLSAMDQVVEYRPHDLTVTVQSGITVAALQQLLDRHGQILALDPPLPDRATVGGTLAANLTGPRRYRYGTARDIVIGTSAVLADGTAIKAGGRVVKNVAGYDLNKLFIGSVGTLAVISEVTFRLLPAPPERVTFVAAFEDLSGAHRMARTVAGSTLSPLSLDLAAPDVAARWQDLAPELTGDGWQLVIELGGTPAAVDRTRAELLVVAKSLGAHASAGLDERAASAIHAALRDFGRLPGDAGALLLRANVLPSQTEQAIELVGGTSVAGVEPAIVARAGNGVVLAAWPAAEVEPPAAVTALRRRIEALGGTLVVERCLWVMKTALDVWGIAGADVALMRRIKQVFDPAGALSPGRGPARI